MSYMIKAEICVTIADLPEPKRYQINVAISPRLLEEKYGAEQAAAYMLDGAKKVITKAIAELIQK